MFKNLKILQMFSINAHSASTELWPNVKNYPSVDLYLPIKNRPRHVQDLHMKASNVLWSNQWEMMILSNW